MIRKPAVAGLFYDKNPSELKKTIEWCFNHKLGPGKVPELGISDDDPNKDNIYGAVVPHAGYSYSGPIAAHAYCDIVVYGVLL